jgi:signal peptidase I
VTSDAFPTKSPILAARTRPPRKWLASLLSLIVPGLGHLYARHPRRAIVAWLICGPVVAALLISPFFIVWPAPPLVAGVVLISLILKVACLTDAWRTAGRAAHQQRSIMPWWTYVLFIGVGASVSYGQATLVSEATIRAFDTVSSSMAPNLKVGDRFVSAMAPEFRREIRYGDIIMFRREGTDWVKRVVGLPGDRITFHEGKLLINGVAAPLVADGTELDRLVSIDFPLFLEAMPDGTLVRIKRVRPGNTHFDDVSVTVPADSYFVLGDNRDQSSDSRVFGPVAAADVTGRAAFIYWSGDLARIGQSLTSR